MTARERYESILLIWESILNHFIILTSYYVSKFDLIKYAIGIPTVWIKGTPVLICKLL